jgi:hypothetical protein
MRSATSRGVGDHRDVAGGDLDGGGAHAGGDNLRRHLAGASHLSWEMQARLAFVLVQDEIPRWLYACRESHCEQCRRRRDGRG